MKSLLAILLLSAGAAHAQCVFVPNSIHCQDKNQHVLDYQERLRQQQQIEQMHRQLDQQRRLNELNAHNAQQPRQFQQHCTLNVFGVIECK